MPKSGGQSCCRPEMIRRVVPENCGSIKLYRSFIIVVQFLYNRSGSGYTPDCLAADLILTQLVIQGDETNGGDESQQTTTEP